MSKNGMAEQVKATKRYISPKTNYVKMVCDSASGRIYEVKLPQFMAFAAARGVNRDCFCCVQLVGKYGTATFKADGGGTVLWNAASTAPGVTTTFEPNGCVCLS